MSIQEYYEVNSVDYPTQKIGHIDEYAQDIYCRSIKVANPEISSMIVCGMILPYYRFSDAMPVCPVGYGICDGSTYDSITYPTVNILSPDLRNNFLRGAFDTTAIYPIPDFTGSNTTTLIAANIPQLSFNCTESDGFIPGLMVRAATIDPQSPPTSGIYPIKIGNANPTAFDNIPLSVSCVYIIKL